MKRISIKARIIMSIVFVMIVGIGIAAVVLVNVANDQLSGIEIYGINLSESDGGNYIGVFDSIPIQVELEVIVQNHQIVDINLIKHRNGQGTPGEAIIDQVLVMQQTDIDVIAGATYSSKAILSAIEDALNQ